MNKNEQHLARSAILLSGVSGLILFFSFIKESLFAYYYGANILTDAFNISIQVPTILFSLISTAISNVVLPIYSKEKINKGKEEADKYISNLMSVVAIITILLIIICEIFSSKIIFIFAPGLEKSTQTTAILLFRIILPTVLLTEMMNINTTILNAHKSFILPSLISVILNISFVFSIIFLNRYFNIYAAVIGVVIGTFLEFFYSIYLRRKYMKYKFILNFKSENIKLSLKNSIPIFIGIGADEINKLVDTAISSFLSVGSITLLNYALKLTTAISMLVVRGITVVVYPDFVENIAKKDEIKLANSFIFSLKIIIIILCPIISGGIILSKEIITLVFCRGAFDIDNVLKTAPLFSCYLISLMFMSIRQISSRLFYSYGDTRTPMKNSIVGVIINIVLNIIFVNFLDALGLALATTISGFCISFLLLKEIKKKNRNIKYGELYEVFFKNMISCIFMLISIKIVIYLFYRMGIYNLTKFFNTGMITILCVSIGIFVYVFVSFLLDIKEIKYLLNTLIKRRRKCIK